VLAIERGVRNKVNLPRLSRQQTLAWADVFHRRTGEWPTRDSGVIPECPGETWLTVDDALRKGRRGLRGQSSLAQHLERRRGRRNVKALPPLTQKKILTWADAHHERTGDWPNVNSGAVVDAPGERWDALDAALRQGHRGLAGGSSLLRLLVKKRGVRDPLHLPPLTVEQVLQWADLHFQRSGQWPKYDGGAIVDAPGETWAAVDSALRYGKRGLSGESSLAKLLAEKRVGKAPQRETAKLPAQQGELIELRGDTFRCIKEN
jgi:hypothetical protein